MIELAQLFQDMEALVVQQEDSVAVIEQKGEEVQENLDKGTEQIGVAIKSARARNRKKWWCLLIVVLIIIVVVVVVVITQVINKPKSTTKRRSFANLHDRAVVESIPWVDGEVVAPGKAQVPALGKVGQPGTAWTPEKADIRGVEWIG